MCPLHIGPAREQWTQPEIPKSCKNQKKISAIGLKSLQILPHFDVNNIAVAQKLTKWHNFYVHVTPYFGPMCIGDISSSLATSDDEGQRQQKIWGTLTNPGNSQASASHFDHLGR